MSYAAYSIDDFLADEFFQAWVLGMDAAAEHHWQCWLQENPSKASEVHEAATLLRRLKTSQPPYLPTGLKEAEAAKLWNAICPPDSSV